LVSARNKTSTCPCFLCYSKTQRTLIYRFLLNQWTTNHLHPKGYLLKSSNSLNSPEISNYQHQKLIRKIKLVLPKSLQPLDRLREEREMIGKHHQRLNQVKANRHLIAGIKSNIRNCHYRCHTNLNKVQTNRKILYPLALGTNSPSIRIIASKYMTHYRWIMITD
jgi:hypothetical protein